MLTDVQRIERALASQSRPQGLAPQFDESEAAAILATVGADGAATPETAAAVKAACNRFYDRTYKATVDLGDETVEVAGIKAKPVIKALSDLGKEE